MLNKNLSLKIEIKDKKLFIQNTITIAAIVILGSIFLWQLVVGSKLQQALTAKNDELHSAQRASKRLKRLEWQTKELEQIEKEINEKAPLDEKHPFSLIKTLAAISDSLGLRRSVFSIKEAKSAPSTQNALNTDQQQEALMQEASPQEGQSSEQPPAEQTIGLTPVYFEMSFEATFGQLLKFLEEILTLKRIVSVEEISITRDKKIIPCQKITLQLTTYTFPKE